MLKRKKASTRNQVLASYYTNFSFYDYSSTAACAAARRAIGTRNGEHEA